jgi:hypothetical protein
VRVFFPNQLFARQEQGLAFIRQSTQLARLNWNGWIRGGFTDRGADVPCVTDVAKQVNVDRGARSEPATTFATVRARALVSGISSKRAEIAATSKTRSGLWVAMKPVFGS